MDVLSDRGTYYNPHTYCDDNHLKDGMLDEQLLGDVLHCRKEKNKPGKMIFLGKEHRPGYKPSKPS